MLSSEDMNVQKRISPFIFIATSILDIPKSMPISIINYEN